MSFRVTGRDLVIFLIFCLFLLYICAVAVLNVTSLLNDGTFYGLLPFAAFKSPYLAATLVVFFAVLTAIFLSVSSHIFDRDKKGIGISFGEKEAKGYSRWAKEREFKKAKDIKKIRIADKSASAAGVALINNGKEMFVDDGENHTMVIGATASGKTTAVVDPLIQSLAKKGESMILTDPKGELHRNHSEMLKNKGYNIIVLNFRNPNLGNAWNPLSLPYRLFREGNTDKAIELLDDVGRNILHDTGSKDPFWENSAADYFSGLALGLFEDAPEELIHLNSISYMSTVGEEKFATSDYIKEYFLLKGEQSSPFIFASNTINAPSETKGGILSVFRQKIRIFSSREQLSEMLAYSDFDVREIGRKKTAVFMIIHDEKTTYHALATIFIKQCYETLIDVAQENDGQLQHRTNFILDEFANMPPLKDVTAMVTAARSRRIRFTFIIQNFAQLNEVYGKDDADTIRSNCGNLIYLITTELAALEEISKLCGEVKSKEKEKTSSTPLISVSDLQKMQLNEVVILRTRLNPFRTKLTPSYEIDWGENFAQGSLPERILKPIDLFDIKEYVKTEKRKKLFESLESMDKKHTEKEEKEENGPLVTDVPSKPLEGFNPFNQPREDNDEDEPKVIETLLVEEISKPIKEDEINENQISEYQILESFKSPEIDLENLVKRIDAKILELEAEEEKLDQKEKVEKLEDISKNDKLEKEIEKTNPQFENFDIPTYEKFEEVLNVEEEKIVSEPIINIDNDSVIVDTDEITEDQYFDDFFGE